MGLYINPPDMSKEKFLALYGTPISHGEALAFDYSKTDELPVCLVDNGAFTAAGIADHPAERDVFAAEDTPRDQRPRQWYLVPIEKLKPDLPKSHPLNKE